MSTPLTDVQCLLDYIDEEEYEELLEYFLTDKQLFVYKCNPDPDINDYLEDHLEEEVIALMLETGDNYLYSYRDYHNNNYTVLTDEEAQRLAEAYAEDYANEAEREVPEHLRQYFNQQEYIDDLASDDRGFLLAPYDGEEREQQVNGTTYCIYRQ